MVLSFSDSASLGTLMTVMATGMLFSSLLLGGLTIKRGYVRLLCLSLFGAGIFMACFGLRANMFLIGISGFLFFTMLPLANTGIDVLLRTNIDNHLQGRAWGLIGLISQLGYVAAYAVSGLLADYLFTPLLLPDGALAGSVGSASEASQAVSQPDSGAGSGMAVMFLCTRILGCVTSILWYSNRDIRAIK